MNKTSAEDRVWFLTAMHEYVRNLSSPSAHIIWLNYISETVDPYESDTEVLFDNDFTEDFKRISEDDIEWKYACRCFSRIFKKY